jgi:hypothetical protein
MQHQKGVMAAAKSSQVLINALTGKVGPGTQVTGYPTYQALDSFYRHFPMITARNFPWIRVFLLW